VGARCARRYAAVEAFSECGRRHATGRQMGAAQAAAGAAAVAGWRAPRASFMTVCTPMGPTPASSTRSIPSLSRRRPQPARPPPSRQPNRPAHALGLGRSSRLKTALTFEHSDSRSNKTHLSVRPAALFRDACAWGEIIPRFNFPDLRKMGEGQARAAPAVRPAGSSGRCGRAGRNRRLSTRKARSRSRPRRARAMIP
jgi:hypothetical protein